MLNQGPNLVVSVIVASKSKGASTEIQQGSVGSEKVSGKYIFAKQSIGTVVKNGIAIKHRFHLGAIYMAIHKIGMLLPRRCS